MAASNSAALLGARIAEKRRVFGISQYQVADYLGVDQGFISKIESGQRAISLSYLEKLCDLFFCSLDDICQEDSPAGERNRGCQVAFRAKGLSPESMVAIAAVGRIARNLDRMVQLERANDD